MYKIEFDPREIYWDGIVDRIRKKEQIYEKRKVGRRDKLYEPPVESLTFKRDLIYTLFPRPI